MEHLRSLFGLIEEPQEENSLLYLGIVKIGGLKLLRISYYQHDNKDYTYKQAVTS